MLERLKDLPGGLVGLRATGQVTKEDYERVFEPLLDRARSEGRRLRVLYDFGPDFESFTPGAAWEDAKLGIRSIRLFDGCAIMSDLPWVRASTRLIGFLMPCPVHLFGSQDRASALEWLRALPDGGAASHRLLPEFGVIVVEIEGALRVQDFEALTVTADTWLEAHGDLQGIVLHARGFPSRENLGSVLRHAQFVRDHHRKVERVALSADSNLAGFLSGLGEHFVKAEVKCFAYDELSSAILWAGTGDEVTLPAQIEDSPPERVRSTSGTEPATGQCAALARQSSMARVCRSHAEAGIAVKKLQSADFDMTTISIVGQDDQTEEHPIGCYNTGDRMKYWGEHGAFWEGLWGFLFGSAFFVVPGVGPLVVAGPLVSCMVDALEGTTPAAGETALGAALFSIGIPDDSVAKYESAIKSGSVLLLAHGTAAAASRAHAIVSSTHLPESAVHLA